MAWLPYHYRAASMSSKHSCIHIMCTKFIPLFKCLVQHKLHDALICISAYWALCKMPSSKHLCITIHACMYTDNIWIKKMKMDGVRRYQPLCWLTSLVIIKRKLATSSHHFQDLATLCILNVCVRMQSYMIIILVFGTAQAYPPSHLHCIHEKCHQ